MPGTQEGLLLSCPLLPLSLLAALLGLVRSQSLYHPLLPVHYNPWGRGLVSVAFAQCPTVLVLSLHKEVRSSAAI